MRNVEQAVSMFKEGFLCSQALLATYGPPLGVSRDTALRLAEGFGGGVARMAGTCGAVSAAFMIISLKISPGEPIDPKAKEANFALIKKFVDLFIEMNGSIICRELLGQDIGTAEGLKNAREEKLFEKACPKYVEDAAVLLEQCLDLTP